MSRVSEGFERLTQRDAASRVRRRESKVDVEMGEILGVLLMNLNVREWFVDFLHLLLGFDDYECFRQGCSFPVAGSGLFIEKNYNCKRPRPQFIIVLLRY